MTQAPVALVAVLRETSVLFAAAIGALILGEPVTRQRLLASAMVLAGLVVLRF
jgi:drug/metabolite transporter (DMT)-like permease